MFRIPAVLMVIAALALNMSGCSKDETTGPQKETVATPSFTPQGGTYTSAQDVTISCPTEGATIYYTIDGVNPDESSTEYDPQNPVEIDTTTTLKAKGYKSGMNSSAVATATYTIDLIDVAAPTFSPPAGTYNTVQDVSIACYTIDATIYYTLDGSDPDESSTQYSQGVKISISVTTTIKARAYKDGMDPSPVSSATYTIDLDDVEAPQFDPPAGTYSSVQEVEISCATQDASIYYTIDGSAPSQYSVPYTLGEKITISTSTMIRARAYKEGMDPSPIANALYTIDLEDVETPQFDPPAGVYGGALEVTISCATLDAEIYYTLDGTPPTESSTLYTEGETISVSSSVMIRARAYKEGMDPSPITDAPYTIVSGLIAYYPFDGDADDESGNGCHGTTYGATLVADRNGSPNSAYSFDGNDYIELANESNFDLRAFTIVLILRMSQLPAAMGALSPGSYALITKGVDYGNYDISLYRGVATQFAQVVYTHLVDTGGIWTTTCNEENLNAGQYYHIAVVRDLDQIKIYIDGTHKHSSNDWMYSSVMNNETVLIGKSPTAGSANHFKGVIDDIKFFDRVLSSSEIQGLYNIDM